MNQVEIVKLIEKIAENTDVKSVTNGDVYNLWNNNEVKYASLCIAFETVVCQDDYNTYNAILYYGDRLQQDDSNFNFIQIDGIRTINFIVNNLKNVDGIDVVSPITMTPFQQNFADYLGGVYARFSIETTNEVDCRLIDLAGKYYDIPLNITIDSNGEFEYTPNQGFVYNKVNVSVNVPQLVLSQLSETIISNGSYEYIPNEGEAYNKVTINVETPVITPIQINETITTNGNYEYVPKEGEMYDYVNFNVETPNVELIEFKNTFHVNGNFTYEAPKDKAYGTITIYVDVPTGGGEDVTYTTLIETALANGTYKFSPKEGEAYNYVEFTVNVPTSGDITEEEVNQMCNSTYEASSKVLEYLTSEGEDARFEVTENGYYEYVADTYFNNVTLVVNVQNSTGDSITNFNDLNYQTNDVIYLGNPTTLKDDLEYSLTLKNNFTGSPTYFDNDTQLVYAPMVDLNLITSESMYQFFFNCQNMVATPTYTLPSWETKLERTFEQCQSLKYVKLIGDNVTELDNTFSNCNSLITFDLEITTDSIGLNSAFNNCQNLVYIPKIGNLGEFNRVTNTTFLNCYKLKKIENVINPIITVSYEQPNFIECYSLEDVKIKINDSNNFLIPLEHSPKLKWDCVKYMIDNAVEGGSHVIYLHSSLELKYNQEPDYQDYMSLATSKGISLRFMTNVEIPEEYL